MRRLPGLLLLPLLLASPAVAQQIELDWFVSIPGVPGCTNAPGQNGKIDILELHQLWYSAESIPPDIKTREFIFSKEMDCATRLLWDNLRQQTQFATVVLEGFDRHPSGPKLRQRIELRDVYIQSIETSDRFPDLPLERLRWIYREVEMSSYCIRPSDQTDCGVYEWTHNFQNPI